jgi:hypothetical protein
MEISTGEFGLSDLPLWADTDAKDVLCDVARKYAIDVDVITELVTLQRERQHQERAHGIYARIEEILGRVADA